MNVLNKETNLFKRICNLPECMIDIIKTYIPTIALIMITKKCYLANHVLVKSYINKKHSEVYIRCMIRQDNDFVFSNILFENYNRWLKMEQYYYKGYIYINYIDFLESYCIEHESIRCRTIILKLLNTDNHN